MDNFKAIYKILTTLEKAMDCPAFDLTQISPERLGVSTERWCRYIEMMEDVGYIKGVVISEDLSGEMFVDADNIRITLKGLEYLQENSIMHKFYLAAKGIKESVPMI